MAHYIPGMTTDDNLLYCDFEAGASYQSAGGDNVMTWTWSDYVDYVSLIGINIIDDTPAVPRKKWPIRAR